MATFNKSSAHCAMLDRIFHNLMLEIEAAHQDIFLFYRCAFVIPWVGVRSFLGAIDEIKQRFR